MLTLNYDKENDTLYLGIGDNTQSYCSEVINNINVFRDMSSDEITGYLVFAFMDKYKNKLLPSIPYISNISFEKDVIPNI